MSELQTAKGRVLEMTAALDAARPGQAAAALDPFVTEDWHWRGVHPFHELSGAPAVDAAYLSPLAQAFAPLQRRRDIFFAARNGLEDGASGPWVVEMGHLLGLWRQPFLGLRPTGRAAFLRYCDFHRMEGDRIAETAHFLDLMNLLHQTGTRALPESTGVTLVTPGPMTHDGLVFGERPAEEGKTTLALIERMIARLVATGVRTTREDLELDWREDMLWWGPGGIGASYSFDGYLEGHTRPFEAGLEFISHNGHVMRGGEGMFGGFFGWPSLTMRPTGGYLGLTSASERTADMRIVDLYRRDGDRLAENWIFIDHLHFLDQLGVDLLERARRLDRGVVDPG